MEDPIACVTNLHRRTPTAPRAVWVFDSHREADARSWVRHLRAQGDRVRIGRRTVSAFGASFSVWVVAIGGGE